MGFLLAAVAMATPIGMMINLLITKPNFHRLVGVVGGTGELRYHNGCALTDLSPSLLTVSSSLGESSIVHYKMLTFRR